LEDLPATPAVLVGNHQGMFDILVLMKYLPRPPVFVAKQELFRIPVLGPGMRAFGHISVDRKNSEKAIASIQTGKEQLLKYQQQVIFFPEGTRTRDGKMLPFKKGAFVFALESGLPIVPFCVRGSYEALPPGVKVVRPGLIEVAFLTPIDPATYPAFATKEELIEHVYALIENQLVEMETAFSERE
jgi:1-acyl-sn-glycerol-3-phosphate acyltransferase